jgi:hypothetical protein
MTTVPDAIARYMSDLSAAMHSHVASADAGYRRTQEVPRYCQIMRVATPGNWRDRKFSLEKIRATSP